eukprot:2510148-Prymnesium_polylepis.1
MTLRSRALLLVVAATACAANRADSESGESKLKPRPGTRCQLLSRDVLTEEDAKTTPPTRSGASTTA